MEILKLEKQKPVEDAALNFTDSRVIGIIFYIAQIGFVFLRKNIGVRILKVEIISFTTSGMFFIAALADWITDLPLLGAKLDYSSFRIFTVLYGLFAIYHMIKAHLDAREIPFTYSRSLGTSHLQELIFKLNMPFIRQSTQRLQAFVEPVVMIVIARVVHLTISPNLGNFLTLVALAMCVIGVLVINNTDKMRWDLNDSIVLAKHTQDNVKDNKTNPPQTRVKSTVSKAPKKD